MQVKIKSGLVLPLEHIVKFKYRRPRVTMNNQKTIKMNAKEINLAVTSNHDIFLVNA